MNNNLNYVVLQQVAGEIYRLAAQAGPVKCCKPSVIRCKLKNYDTDLQNLNLPLKHNFQVENKLRSCRHKLQPSLSVTSR